MAGINGTIVTGANIRELGPDELDDAARLLGSGMCDNPANVRSLGIPDAEHRRPALTRFFAPVLRGLHRRGLIFGAFRKDILVGVCGMARPGLCQPPLMEKLTVVPAVVFGNSAAATLRVLRWAREWARHDLREPHWHLGPVAVDFHLQGHGIGGAMLIDVCARMDDCGGLSYLETDKSENVRFYENFGFKVIEEAAVLGIPNWFMLRTPRSAPKEAPSQVSSALIRRGHGATAA